MLDPRTAALQAATAQVVGKGWTCTSQSATTSTFSRGRPYPVAAVIGYGVAGICTLGLGWIAGIVSLLVHDHPKTATLEVDQGGQLWWVQHRTQGMARGGKRVLWTG